MPSVLLVESAGYADDLRAAGHAIVIATVREATTVLREGGIDLVVIECHGDCHGLLALSNDIHQLPDAPPLVLLSGSVAAPEMSARIGAAAFLPKPCDVAEVVDVVTRIAGRARPVLQFADEPTGRTHSL